MKGVDHLSIYWNTHCESRINLPFDRVIVCISLFISFVFKSILGRFEISNIVQGSKSRKQSNELWFENQLIDVFHDISVLLKIVLHPTNINLHLQLILKFAERNFERPIMKGIYDIEHINFQIDPKQLSDLLDFIKFQNYSVFYGTWPSLHSHQGSVSFLGRSLSRISSIIFA